VSAESPVLPEPRDSDYGSVRCRWPCSFTVLPTRSNGPGEGAHRALYKCHCREGSVGLPERKYPEVQKQLSLVWVKIVTYAVRHERYTSIL
jgi:hypothetical protein